MNETFMKEKPIFPLLLGMGMPMVLSMLVNSLYNIVDQIFIGQGVGMLGNAATNIAFPVSIICTATALLLGSAVSSISDPEFHQCHGHRFRSGDQRSDRHSERCRKRE